MAKCGKMHGIPFQGKLTNRGNLTVWDFTLTDFITDDDWHILDLSSIVPEDTVVVMFRVRMRNSKVGSKVIFKEAGIAQGINASAIKIQAGNAQRDTERWVFVNDLRQVEYLITDNTNWSQLDVAVRGYSS
jgi:hypothetical protein